MEKGTSRTPAEPSPALDPRFSQTLFATIDLLNRRLSSEQLDRLSSAMPRVLWEFPDVPLRVCLAIDPAPRGLRIVEESGEVPIQVQMPRAVFENAANGVGSLGAAFLTGRLRVRGLNPLRLRDFVSLVEPLLSSYRDACHGR